MYPPGASMSFGPLLSLDSEPGGNQSGVEQAFENVKSNLSESSPLDFSPSAEISIDGWNGLSADFTGVIEGQNVAGRALFVNAGSSLDFLAVAVAPAQDWASLSPLFQDVISSVTFTSISSVEPLCGDGSCGDFEHSGNCPQDCGQPEPEPLCGDGYCGDFEHSGNCPQDCGQPEPEPLCGDGYCGDFEHSGNCPQDCGQPEPEPLCGDGYCGDFEHPGNCPQDCGNP